ncbi:MAG: hypothetical protein ALAOOOJD_03740 [bacterium]|nr:hypothetical protein [bacterium]
MRNKVSTYRFIVAVLTLFGLLAWSAMAKEPANAKRSGRQSLYKTTGSPRYQILNINNLWTWYRADGLGNHSPGADNGTYYPRGTKWVIYQDGFMFGAKAYVDAAKTVPAPLSQLIRVGGSTYGVGTREGYVTGSGATAAPANPGDADVRAYRVRRDWQIMSDDELKRDAAETNEIGVAEVSAAQMQKVKDQYTTDWANWPVKYGAPYIDRNNNGKYDPPPAFSNPNELVEKGYDEPGVAGGDPNSPADQVVWLVYNDLDRNQTLGLYGSEPLGLEIQLTLWGYKRSDALGNIYFKRYRIINKGGVAIDAAGTKGTFTLDSVYCAQWADPDLGSFADDLAGCDVDLSMGFIYNGNAIDSDYKEFNLVVPAAGFDFLAGPRVAKAGSEAVFDFKKISGYENLGMSSFSYFSAGAPISDPPGSYAQGTQRWYRMLKGFAPVDIDNQNYPFPPGMTPTKFPLSGDPVKRTGFIDGLGTTYSFAPGDRRLNLSTGPFNMAPGDTQEVVVAFVAGQGSDRLSSVAVMKFNDRFAQNTFNALFQVPKAPPAPDVKVAELDGQIIMEWGSNLTRVNEIENTVNQPGEYTFEGYNIYQLPGRNASLSEAKRITTYDLPDDPTVVLDEQFDLKSGQILNIPVQFGANSGVTRYFKMSRDYLLDLDKLYNGQTYYVAVTAYSVARQAGFLPAALESAPLVITVQPKRPFGTAYQTTFGDTLHVSHTSATSLSDGSVLPIVINPAGSTGDTYEVGFATDANGETTWSLKNKTKNKMIMENQTNQSGDTNYNLAEGGVYVVVSGPPPGVNTWAWTGTRFLTWAGGEGLAFEGFNGALGWASARSVFGDGTHIIPADKLKKIEVRFANAAANDLEFDPNQPNVSYAYRHGRGFAGAPAKPEFAPFIINKGGSYSYQDFTKSVPLAVYDVDANPPRRLAVAFLENNASGGKVDGRYNPGVTGASDNVAAAGPREWLWIFDADYSETPNPAWQTEIIAGPQPVMYFATWLRRNTNAWTDANVMTIVPNRPNTPNDVFTYTTPAPEKNATLEQASASNIGVYPNPYYAFNPAESNRLFRFVTFNNMPPQATVRIFNLGGQLVRVMKKDDASQFLQWDLLNHDNIPVASGMYIAHVEAQLPSGGKSTKVLKLAIIQEQEVLDIY